MPASTTTKATKKPTKAELAAHAKAEAEAKVAAEAAERGISAKELASRFDTDPKSLRRWLRSITTNRAGKGHRWVFTPETVTELTKLWDERKAKGTEPELVDSTTAETED